MNLKDVRNKIDILDSKLLKLLNERMELTLMTKKLKTEIEDRKREEELLQTIRKSSKGLIDPGFCEKLYVEIISESKRLQKEGHKLIAFVGEHGANAEAAANLWDESLIPIPCSEYVELFEGIDAGVFDFAAIPIENTLGGVVSESNELLVQSNVSIVGAVDTPIHHCLMSLPDTDYRDIRTVYSHPQALVQCRNFLERNNLEPANFYNTAAAAKMLFEKKPRGAAVIASKLAAELYHLEIIKENIEDHESNRTRFLVISKEPSGDEGNKCSILFTTAHKAGTLFKVLEIFARESINLSRIESIPYQPGVYAFFLDFIGSKNEERVKTVLRNVEEQASVFKFMGCYNEKTF